MYTTINLIQYPEQAEKARRMVTEHIKEALKIDLCQNLSSIKMLDVGCGAGNLVRYVKSLGVDAQGVDVNLFHNNDDIPITQCNIADMPFADNTFNLIYAQGVFDPRLYPQDLNRSFAQIARVMQSKGLLAVIDMDMPAGDIMSGVGLEILDKYHGGRILFQKK